MKDLAHADPRRRPVDRALDLDKRHCDEGWASGGDAVGRLLGLADGYLRFAREHPGHFRVFRFPPPDAPADGLVAAAAQRVAERVGSEVERMAGQSRRRSRWASFAPSIPGARRSSSGRHGTA